MAGLEASPVPATLALPLVLRVGVNNRLPLHVARFIRTGNRDDVVGHVALAGGSG